jgi:hypothetical protein
MNMRLNRQLFTETGADSGALGMLATIVHRPRESGDYAGSVYLAEEQVGEFTLRVVDEETPLSVHIDLANPRLQRDGRRQPLRPDQDDCGCLDHDSGGDDAASTVYSVGRQGYVVFHVSEGSGGYHVQLAGPLGGALLERREGDNRAKADIWSSRELESGDLFAVTLLRPGTYKVSNERGGEAKLRLHYPERGKIAYRPPEPQRVAVTDNGFEPAGFELRPMQGQVFEISTTARINISLVEPEDRDERPDPDRARPTRYTLRRRMASGGLAPRDSSGPNA